jgi:hypothetical protein
MFAQEANTSEELAEREQFARDYLRDRMGVQVDADAMEASARLRARIAHHGDAA